MCYAAAIATTATKWVRFVSEIPSKCIKWTSDTQQMMLLVVLFGCLYCEWLGMYLGHLCTLLFMTVNALALSLLATFLLSPYYFITVSNVHEKQWRFVAILLLFRRKIVPIDAIRWHSIRSISYSFALSLSLTYFKRIFDACCWYCYCQYVQCKWLLYKNGLSLSASLFGYQYWT